LLPATSAARLGALLLLHLLPASAAPGATGPDTGPAAALRFAVVGDYGNDSPDEAAVAALIRGWSPDFIITTGDNNYPGGTTATIDTNIGKYFHDFIGGYAGRYGAGSARNRFWPSPGNHDWLGGIDPYVRYFALPGNERYYDVDMGLVHIFALDSDDHEPDGVASGSAQRAWLKQRLRDSRACYDVVFFHHPPYNSGHHGSSRYMRWPFASWGADVVMAGHDHHYERLDVGGTPYFVSGAGGAPLNPAQPIVPESRFRFAAGHGAMLVTATRTGITYEFWTVDGKKIDSLHVDKRCDSN